MCKKVFSYQEVVRKIICLMFLLFSMNFFYINHVMAKEVQVCDLGAYKLYEKAYTINKMIKADWNYAGLSHIGVMTKDSPYDNYCTTIGEKGHASLVTFYTNKAGDVSKITIFCKCNDSLSERIMGMTLGNILISLGLNENEFKVITNVNKWRSRGTTDVWGSRINRRIVLEFFTEKNKLNVVRITAFDS